MKAITVKPGVEHSAQVADLPRPRLEDVPGERGVLVKVLRVGLDGTDKEIDAGLYGTAPPGSDYLVLGHESFGVVEKVGAKVTELAPGDFVVAMVRHPGHSLYDTIGLPDMTTDELYEEHGISRLHGFLAEYYVDQPEYLVRIPGGLKQVAVLMEPSSVVEKGLLQAWEIQRRLKVWNPRKAAVIGPGTLGLLATLFLRLRGLEVVTMGLGESPSLKTELIDGIGATYASAKKMTLAAVSEMAGPFDLIFEASGYSPAVFEAMQVLGKNGVLVATSVTSGDRKIEVPADFINLQFVLGNKVLVGSVNANREAFEAAVRDLAMSEAQYPGWLGRLLTREIRGLDACPQQVKLLESEPGDIKTYVEVAPLP